MPIKNMKTWDPIIPPSSNLGEVKDYIIEIPEDTGEVLLG